MWSLQFFSSSVKQDYEDKHGPAAGGRNPRELITGAGAEEAKKPGHIVKIDN